VIYELACLKPPFQAKDMKGLYTKVIKGVYPKLPGYLSQDLHRIIDSMLEVDPVVRPSAEEIMAMPVFHKRKIDIQVSDESSEDELLGTIRVPKNLTLLTERLPTSQYESNKRRKSKASHQNGMDEGHINSDTNSSNNSK